MTDFRTQAQPTAAQPHNLADEGQAETSALSALLSTLLCLIECRKQLALRHLAARNSMSGIANFNPHNDLLQWALLW
jgi:hypothetical protein